MVRGRGAVGRNPGVRPVLDPVMALTSVKPIDEKSRSGPEVEEGGRPRPGAGLGGSPGGLLGRRSGRRCRRHGATGGSQGSKGCENTGRGHTNGERRMVSYMRGHTRGGCRVTVVMYRNLLSWCKELHVGISSLGAKSVIS